MEGEREAKRQDQELARKSALTAFEGTVQADLLLLLRMAFRDGPLNERARNALADAALRLGVAEERIDDLLRRLEHADSHAARVLSGFEKGYRLRLLQNALDLVALDVETAGGAGRLRSRLMLLLDLAADDLAGPAEA